MTSMPGNNWGVIHLILKNPLAAVCVGVAGVGGFLFNTDGSRLPIVSVTFDDGYESQYDIALPAMMVRDLTGTLYLTTGDGTDFVSPLSENQVRMFLNAGWELGGHTINHGDLTEMEPLEVLANLMEPKDYMFETYGVVPTSFASPYGAYNDDVLYMISAVYHNHVNAWSARDGMNYVRDFNPYEIHRLDVGNSTAVEICDRVSVIPNDTWLSVIFHQIVPSEAERQSQWDTTQADFETILDCIALERNEGEITVNLVTEAAIEMQGDAKRTADAAIIEQMREDAAVAQEAVAVPVVTPVADQ